MTRTIDSMIVIHDQSIDRVMQAGLPLLLVTTNSKLKRRVVNTLHQIAKANAGKLLVAKLQTEENPQSVDQYKLPGNGVLSFKDGQESARTEGVATNATIEEHAGFLLQGGEPPIEEAGAGEPVHVTDATFERDVLKSPQPVLVDFWAPWCGPCRMVAPTLERIAADYAGQLTVAKVNTDENPYWAGQYGVRGIPTLLLIKDGQLVERMVGVQPEPVLRAAVDRSLN